MLGFIVRVLGQFLQNRETATSDLCNRLARLFGNLAIEFRLGHGFAFSFKKQSDHPGFGAVAQEVKPPHCGAEQNSIFNNYQRFPDRHS